ncbi:hypothetical protein JQ032_18955 [Clostridium botulinum]|nr:hypothetical protein [Clostridium botulinum]
MGATVLWGGLFATIIISMKKITIQKIAKYKIKINGFGVLNESISCFITERLNKRGCHSCMTASL